jgi:hypothetical protein
MPLNKITTWSFMVVCLLLMQGCQSLEIPLGIPMPTERENIIFQDDFSNPESGWQRASGANGINDYDDGVYQIRVDAINSDIWSTIGMNVKNTIIEVDTFKAGGSRDNRFGILCRAVSNEKFYLLMISSDGYYGIGKVNGNQYQLLNANTMMPSDMIKKGSAFNQIRADCVDNQLRLWVNGIKLVEITDDEYMSGDIGIFAGTYSTPGTDIRFDDFIVKEP